MFDKDAIKELSHAVGIDQAAQAVATGLQANRGTVALPNDFKVHSLESRMPTRLRSRGNMLTTSIGDFARYAKDHAEEGATVFVDADAMTAEAVLNLGTSQHPGHCDNTAELKLRKTAEFTALLYTADGRSTGQQAMVEFFEDWISCVEFYADEEGGQMLKPGAALGALRKLTIDTARKVESTENSLSASVSAFESVKASADTPIPTTIYFHCIPYQGLERRTFVLRLSVLTTNEKPTLALRIRNLGQHQDEMAAEFAAKLSDALGTVQGEALPIFVGTYTVAQ